MVESNHRTSALNGVFAHCCIGTWYRLKVSAKSLQCLQDAAAGSVSVQEELTDEVMKMYLLQNQDGSVHEYADVGIVMERNAVLSSLGDQQPAAVCWG